MSENQENGSIIGGQFRPSGFKNGHKKHFEKEIRISTEIRHSIHYDFQGFRCIATVRDFSCMMPLFRFWRETPYQNI